MRLVAGALDTAGREALKPLAALHYVRSYAFEEIFNRLSEGEREAAPARIGASKDACQAFESEYGRAP